MTLWVLRQRIVAALHEAETRYQEACEALVAVELCCGESAELFEEAERNVRIAEMLRAPLKLKLAACDILEG